MADETPAPDDKCVACDIAWYALVGLGVAVIAFITWDVLTQGQASELAGRVFAGFKPKLAVVKPIRSQDESDAS